ncbi:energy transducer TonB [Sphingomonas sp. AOB5]|uniref:energy transducer TonB n=1 Tax=Sphingomonas sp. AOB5 TaxID=3034017 RepID=UPI0023FA1232|nr:energy transducer TonB [Sphingomonas sp. AOB5]MDF7773794.1 energy transducer TonB [Sphingomonas sp. AOB5]
MRGVFAMIGVSVAAMLAMAPQPAAAQSREKTGVCTSRVERSETYRSGNRRITTFYFQYRNDCPRPIRLHYCVVYSSDQAQCARTMYQWADLRAGQTIDVRGRGQSYVHILECGSGDPLVDVRSRVTGRSTIECQSAAAVAAPESNPGAAFSGIGDAPNLSLPRATARPGYSPFTAEDYPARMMERGAEGTTIVALAINATGRVTGCKVTQSSGFAELDRATCAVLMRRGRFNPAVDSSGNPAAGVYPEYRMGWARN